MSNRIIIILIVSCFAICAFEFKKEKTSDELILWKSNIKLSWDDFQGTPDQNSEFDAMTSVNIKYKFDIKENEINTNVNCFFSKNLSWTKEKSSSLLNHEQLHFDIAELITRKMRKELLNHVSKSIETTQIFLNEMKEKYFYKSLDSVSSQYDFETNFSKNEIKQKEWGLKIMKQLNALEKYASTKVAIKRTESKK